MYGKLYENPGMKGSLTELLDRAWRLGRGHAVQAQAQQAGPEGWVTEKSSQRSWQGRLPLECPYSFRGDRRIPPVGKRAEPEPGVGPAAGARQLNSKLGRGYPVPHRAPECEGGRSRCIAPVALRL